MKKITLPPSPRYKMGLSVQHFDKLYLEDLNAFNRLSQHKVLPLRRALLKTQRFPYNHRFIMTRPTYEVRGYTSINHKNQMFREGIDIDAVIYFKNSRGTCAYINADPFHTVDQCYMTKEDGIKPSHRYLFTPHFFERYEMRHGWEDGYKDIHDQFFFRNFTCQPKGEGFVTNLCKSRPGDYKTIDAWGLLQDGLMLGQIYGDEETFNRGEDYIIQMNTFVDFDTLTRRQDKYADLLKLVNAYFLSLPDKSPARKKYDDLKRTFVINI